MANPTTHPAKQFALLPVITALTALGSISVSMYLPSLPSLAVALHATAASIKLSLTAFLFVFAFSQLAYGPLSDRFGRKPPIVAGLGIYLLGSLLCALAINAPALIAARMVQALGAAAGPALGRAVVRDLYAADRLTSALAVIAAAVALSPMLGPVVGGYVQTSLGWRANFYILLGAGVCLLLAVWFLLPETNQHIAPDGLKLASIRRNYATLLLDSEYVAALCCGGFLTAGNFAWTAAAPFLFVRLFHFRPEQYGNLALVVGAGYVAGTLLSGRLSRSLTPPTLVYSGMSCTVVASFALLGFLLSSARLCRGRGRNGPFHHWHGRGSADERCLCVVAASGNRRFSRWTSRLPADLHWRSGHVNRRPLQCNQLRAHTAYLLVITSLAATAAAYVALRPFHGRIVSTTVSHA